MAERSPGDEETTLVITNEHGEDILLIVEPWAEEFRMVPKERLELWATVQNGQWPYLDFSPGMVKVWITGSIRVIRDGVVIFSWYFS